jgi:hypothetical protein
MGVKLGLLTLRVKHRLRVFENRLLRRIFRWKRDEVTGGWRVKANEIDRACSTNGGGEECIKDIDEKARRKEITRKTKT